MNNGPTRGPGVLRGSKVMWPNTRFRDPWTPIRRGCSWGEHLRLERRALLLLRYCYGRFNWNGWVVPHHKMPPKESKPSGTRLVQTSLRLALSVACQR